MWMQDDNSVSGSRHGSRRGSNASVRSIKVEPTVISAMPVATPDQALPNFAMPLQSLPAKGSPWWRIGHGNPMSSPAGNTFTVADSPKVSFSTGFQPPVSPMKAEAQGEPSPQAAVPIPQTIQAPIETVKKQVSVTMGAELVATKEAIVPVRPPSPGPLS